MLYVSRGQLSIAEQMHKNFILGDDTIYSINYQACFLLNWSESLEPWHPLAIRIKSPYLKTWNTLSMFLGVASLLCSVVRTGKHTVAQPWALWCESCGLTKRQADAGCYVATTARIREVQCVLKSGPAWGRVRAPPLTDSVDAWVPDNGTTKNRTSACCGCS